MLVLTNHNYLFHLIDGVGLPEARHFNVTFEPSRATTSVDVNESSIFGGTANKNRTDIHHFQISLTSFP